MGIYWQRADLFDFRLCYLLFFFFFFFFFVVVFLCRLDCLCSFPVWCQGKVVEFDRIGS